MYVETVGKGDGALFIAVQRGKLSEGIDFSDELVCEGGSTDGLAYTRVECEG
jgi:Rad3-related DNA helicase